MSLFGNISNEKIVLSAFDFKPPYVMNQCIFLAPYGEWFALISRVPISEKEEDGCSMDYQAVLVHTYHNREKRVVIPVPDIFFGEHFIPSLPSTPLPSLPPPTHHCYPPLPSHIDVQLGHTGGSVARCRVHSIREPQSIDMNALREEVKEMISATFKEKLHSDADSVTTVSQSMLALDANAQYWSDLSNKAARHSCRALELQLKLAEEKVNTLLHKEAPEEALLEAAQESHTICFQLDQNMCLCEAGLMPEQQVRFSADTGRNIHTPSRNYGVNPINEVHIDQPETYAPFARQSTPALSMTAQLDGAVVNMTSEYSGIQQMVRQAIQNASQEEEPESLFWLKPVLRWGILQLTVDRRVAGARIEEVILEEDEGQIEESDEYAPHPEEQQEYEDQPEEDDQQLYGIRVWEAEMDLRVSAVLQTGVKGQPVYDHQARKKAHPLPTRG
ncbi:hypothetical protein M422DRAFT_257902 [Sphaerobolus stellatus SS14]|uniref:Uncharacterized protein n=1 Tax=Sphaerobolus stellatus (strain SS14) TaxID=990650 RepID=A0A0C9VNH1_SPHS4|nr:hypothetical protein M422DRAFT_257902 [Sphaerobolus stellatus SS14]